MTLRATAEVVLLDCIDRINLVGGWSCVQDEHRRWFLCNPAGIWVAHFWDGPAAGEQDARQLAEAIARGIDTRSAETERLGPKGESPVANGDAPKE